MRPNDESTRRPAERERTSRRDLRVPLDREAGFLPWRWAVSASPLPLVEIVQAAGAVAGRPGAILAGGGDALERNDLWELLAELARLRPAGLGLCVAGPGLTGNIVQRLRAAGVERVHVPFHCARQDAHDWLVGWPGALKAAHRALRTCIEESMPVAAEIVLTRPTAPHLAETVQVLARVGVRAIHVRRLTASDAPGAEFASLSPRLSLLGGSFEQAAAIALERRVRLRFQDLPVCVAPRLRPLFALPDYEVPMIPDAGARDDGGAGPGCADCPGPPRCAGAPADYVARFGWEEFGSPQVAATRLDENVAEQIAARPTEPMVFTWRGPHRVRCAACADDGGEQASPEPTRAIRARMVQAARYRPSRVRLVGAEILAHPQAAALIYDAVRLFAHVEIAGEASAVAEWSDIELRRMKDVRRVDVALYGPDAAAHDAHCRIAGAFAAMQRAVQRLRQTAKIPVGAYAILHDARQVPAFAELWSHGRLPGEPRFRLSARGSSLDELARAAGELAPGPVRSALLAVLPRCTWEGADIDDNPAAPRDAERIFHFGRSEPYRPCGSDPLGAFEPCDEGVESCNVSGCPGKAVGWQSTARSKRWTVNS